MSNRRKPLTIRNHGPQRNACRPHPGGERFPDGQPVHIWTLRDGAGLLHDHHEGRCPYGPGGSRHGLAERDFMSMAGRPCACCGDATAYSGPVLS